MSSLYRILYRIAVILENLRQLFDRGLKLMALYRSVSSLGRSTVSSFLITYSSNEGNSITPRVRSRTRCDEEKPILKFTMIVSRLRHFSLATDFAS